MKLDDAFPSKFLKASDLPEEGTITVTIEQVAMAEVGMDKQRKLVINFEEQDKAMICNQTNAKTIAKVTGSRDTDEWIGKQIRLHRADVEFKGDMVESIRVSTKAGKPSAKAEPEDIF